AIYDFTWSEFCDWYVEMSKGRLRDEAARATVQRVLVCVLDDVLRLAHPILPFVTESLWQALGQAAPERSLGAGAPARAAESVTIAPWPEGLEGLTDPSMEARIGRMQDLVQGVREVRNHYRIDQKTPLDVSVRCEGEVAADFRTLEPFLR